MWFKYRVSLTHIHRMRKTTELIKNLLHVFLACVWSQGVRSRQGFPHCQSAQGWASAGSSGWCFWAWQNGSACGQLCGVSKGWVMDLHPGWAAGAAHNSHLQPETIACASDSHRSRIWPLRLLSHSYFCPLGQSLWTWMQGFSLETSFLRCWESNLKTGKLLHLILVGRLVVF